MNGLRKLNNMWIVLVIVTVICRDLSAQTKLQKVSKTSKH